MVAVTYEQQRGLRDQHEKPEGFEISISRTVGASLAQLYQSFHNEKKRSDWLPEAGLTARTATLDKSMRFTWKDGKTILAIAFSAKGDNKSQVVVQHSKLPDAKSAARMKTYWGQALDRLRELLER